MTASVDYEGKLGPIKLASDLHMLLESLFQARKSSGHIYVCLLYRLSLCDFFYWILEPFQPCDISIGFCNCSDSVIFFELFRQCDICCLSFYPSPGTSLCFLFIVLSTIFVFLSLFFIWSLCCLSFLKKSLKTPKG